MTGRQFRDVTGLADLTIGQGLRLEDVREWTAEEMGIGGGS